MSNTVITNFTDLNGPSARADNSVVIVNKDGSLSVDEKVLGTLMSNDGSQGPGITVVRVGHEGLPDDATDSDTDNEDVSHVTFFVDSYCNEPNSIISYASGAELLHSLRMETRENSLIGFHNDHCYTALELPSNTDKSDTYTGFSQPVIEIKSPPSTNTLSNSKKITILDEQVLPKGRKLLIKPSEGLLLKGNDVLNKPILGLKSKHKKQEKTLTQGNDKNVESSSISSSGDSVPDRDSDSDYKDSKDGTPKVKRARAKPRILKSASKIQRPKQDTKAKFVKTIKHIVKKDNRLIKNKDLEESKNIGAAKAILPEPVSEKTIVHNDQIKDTPKQIQKLLNKKEKKTPSHVTQALLSDMTSLFTSPDVIRRVSTDNKTMHKDTVGIRKSIDTPKISGANEEKSLLDKSKILDTKELLKEKVALNPRVYSRRDKNEKESKSFDPMPQIDDVSLAQILQDNSAIASGTVAKPQTVVGVSNSPSLGGPLSPTLDLLASIQPEEEGLTEDLLMHVAQLVESSDNLKEVLDTQVLGKVDTVQMKVNTSQVQQAGVGLFAQTPQSKLIKVVAPRKDPIEIVRRDGRVITLPPIEAPATRSSKRKSQLPTQPELQIAEPEIDPVPIATTPEPRLIPATKSYTNKKVLNRKQENLLEKALSPSHNITAFPVDPEDNLNSEDDPNRLWCICKQPHNNRFMICCDRCEDWFHGKCVNITKAMGYQMEQQGIEWTCPNCLKKSGGTNKILKQSNIKSHLVPKRILNTGVDSPSVQRHSVESKPISSKSSCIVCKKSARASSIYCSDACILKHAQDSLGTPQTTNKDGGNSSKSNAESRVIVFERKTGRCLAGPNAPTADNLRAWLQKNPTYEVVRPGTLSTIKPKPPIRKSQSDLPKVQTTLQFEKIPRKSLSQVPATPQQKQELKELKIKEEQQKAPLLIKSPMPKQTPEVAKPTIKSPKPSIDSSPPKRSRLSLNRSLSTEKPQSSPVSSRQKEREPERKHYSKRDGTDPIRTNVRKALQEQITQRMAENKDSKFTREEIVKFAVDTEKELHELFKEVGVKYKAKYRSLMFNIKDRKNLSLWQKICDKSIAPKQLVRLSPEELASQELAEWRDNEAKHQLELIKKSELDLLAANKTYVLKTHKGEEVMETKTAVSTELDPNMPVEDLVTALNDSTGVEETPTQSADATSGDTNRKSVSDTKSYASRKRSSDDSGSSRSKKKELKGDERRSSRSTRSSQNKQREEKTTRKSKKDMKSIENDSSKSRHERSSKRKSRDHSRHRSRSRSKSKSKRRSKSKEHSRTRSHSQERSSRSDRSKSRSHSKHRSRSRQRRSSRNKTKSHTKHSPEKISHSDHRSKSQETEKYKGKNDSTDSDMVERPKSAMQREIHPEYDPHEPMITSAFSDEDLRKSREDVFSDSYKTDGSLQDTPFKGFSDVDCDIEKSILDSSKCIEKLEKLSEAESDQEPSSTVDMSSASVWNGCINMVDVARFYVAAHEISGNGADLEDELSTELDIVGRIKPDMVWDYINKMKRSGNKDIVVLRLTAANDEEKMQYIALYSYLSNRNRLGVVKVSNTSTVKDFYILPLGASGALPPALQHVAPLAVAPRSHLLVAIVVRQRNKRAPAATSRSARRRQSHSPTLRLPYASPALSSSVKDKIAASLACADDEEAYSPGSSISSEGAPGATSLRTKMDELNRQIEEQKQQIRSMAQADSSVGGEDEAYSPSRPMTPPSVMPLADISLPSNLQEILATIKQRSEAIADVDMRIQ